MAADFGCIGDSCAGTGGTYVVHTPFWGGTGTSSYKLLLLLHIAAVIATFGPTFLWPALTRLAGQLTGDDSAKVAKIHYALNRVMFLPALLAAMVFGILLTADSSKVYSMNKPWVSGAFAVVIALALISWFFVRPAQKRMIEGLGQGEDGARSVRSARASIAAGTGFYHLGLIVLLVLMIWKPGQ